MAERGGGAWQGQERKVRVGGVGGLSNMAID